MVVTNLFRHIGKLLAAERSGSFGRTGGSGQEDSGNPGILPPGGIPSSTLQRRTLDHRPTRRPPAL